MARGRTESLDEKIELQKATLEKAKAKYAKSRKFCGFERKYDRGCEQRKRNDFDGKVYAEPGKHVFDGHNGILRNGSAVEKDERKYCHKRRVGDHAESGGQGVNELICQNKFGFFVVFSMRNTRFFTARFV